MKNNTDEYFLFWGVDASEALSVPAEKVTHHTCGPYDKVGDKHNMQGRPFGVLGGDASDHYADRYYDEVYKWEDPYYTYTQDIFGNRTATSKPVTSPLDVQEGGSHYKNCAIQPIEYAMKNNLDHCQANIIKYTTRFRDKGGKEDLLKARHYIDLLIEFEYGE